MVLGLRPLLRVFVILWLSLHRCRALDNSVPSWARGFRSRNKTLGPNQLMECETLDISLSRKTNDPSRGDVSYHVLAFEPGGKAVMSLVGYEPSSLHWTIQHPAGTQFFVALLDSFGTFLGVLQAIYTVIPGSTDCLTKSESLRVLETTQPKIFSSDFGRLIPCGSWEMSFSDGKTPYSVSIVDLESGSVYGDSVPPGEHIPSDMSSGESSGPLIAFVSDTNGDTLRTASTIVDSDLPSAQDTPLADSSDVLSKSRPAQPRELPHRLHKLPRPTPFRFRRTLPDHPHMELSRDSGSIGTVNMTYTDKVAVAVCASLAGTGVVAMAIYIMIYRRRRKLRDAQDTLPRPFEVTVPAATASMSMMTQRLTPPPTLGIPRRIYSQSGGRSRRETRRAEFSARIKPSGRGSAPTPSTTAPPQSQPSSSHITHMQSDASLLSNHAGPSSYHTPPRSSTRPHTLTSPDPQSQPGSRVQPGQSTSLPTGPQTQRTADVSASRSASVQERRSDKRALWLSRSASELYSAHMSSSRHRVPEYGSHDPHASSGGYIYRHDGSELHVDTFPRPTNHLRQWHSASPVAHVQRVRLDSEEDLGAAIIFQHQDAGVMQELPPPYHKLVRSDVDV